MGDRRKRSTARSRVTPRVEKEGVAVDAGDRAQLDAELARARAVLTEQALPGIEDFRAYMTEQNRRLEVAAYLDHIEGPQIVVHISRADGRISATLIAAVSAAGIRPSWGVQSSGRVNTRWTESVRGGLDGLTREYVTRKLTDFYNTDFS